LGRAQAEQQAAKQQRQTFLAQVLAEPEEPPPALAQVAKTLNATDGSLQEQFPAESALIVQRSQAYRTAEKQAWQEALQAALSDESGPSSLAQVARRLGHSNSQKLRFHFPELCRRIVQRHQADLAKQRQTIQSQLEAILAEGQVPAPTLIVVAHRLGSNEATLKRLFPTQVQALLAHRRQAQDTQKLAAERALQVVLADDQGAPPSMKALAKELGYAPDTLRAYFPDLTGAIQAKAQAFSQARSQKRHQQLREEIKRLTQELYRQGLDPTLRQIALRLPSPKLIMDPQVRQAWREARQDLGLPP
jgi:hypothetical protein